MSVCVCVCIEGGGAFLAQAQRSMETTTYITAGEAKRGDA